MSTEQISPPCVRLAGERGRESAMLLCLAVLVGPAVVKLEWPKWSVMVKLLASKDETLAARGPNVGWFL